MYSMVLMAALTTGTDVPDFGRRGGCRGGCYGGCYGGWGGCYGGGGWGGCYGGGWGGCYGGGGWGGCYGGYGGGWGACYGGYGGGWGCGGMAYGGGYTYGSGYGAMPSGGYAYSAMPSAGYAYGGSYMSPYAVSWTGIPYASGYGWRSSPYGTWTSAYWNPATGQPYVPSDITGGNERYGTSGGTNGGTNGAAANGDDRATIIVHLPADAKLTVDGERTTSTGEVRTFHSPPLPPGKKFSYTLDGTITRNGKTVKDSKTVEVEAGKTRDVRMEFPEKKGGDT